MQRIHSVYSGTVVRGDCQWKIARRIVVWSVDNCRHERPLTALSAWMAVDGSAYQSPTPLPKEDIHNLLQDLDPLVDRVKEDRLNAGLSFEQSVFVAHATDVYEKHHRLIEAFYVSIEARGANRANHLSLH